MNFFYDPERDLLVYRTPTPLHSQPLLKTIPDAREINGQFVAVPRTLHNSQLLRWLGYPVVPLITDHNYSWPIDPKHRPLAHQKIIANFVVLHRRCLNLTDAGGMKTLPTLWACDWLMHQYPPGECRALIVAPLSILESTWANAIFANFLGRRSFRILHGSAERRLERLAEPADFYVTNHDGIVVGAHTHKRFELDGFSKALVERADIKIAVIDECTAFKDAGTRRHQAARLVLAKREHLCLMTGTPTPQSPLDAYGQAKLVNNAFGKSKYQFRDETMVKVSQFKWMPRKDGYDRARKLLTPAIRFAIEDIWDGPSLTVQQRVVELTSEQKRLLTELKRDLQVIVKSGAPITIANEAAARSKFLQISQGAIYDAGHKEHLVDAAPRIAEAESIVESTSRKILIFANLTSIIDILYKRLSKTRRFEVINGAVSLSERKRIIEAFEREPDLKGLLLDPQATAHGINQFVAADTVLWYSAIDKAELYEQGNKRAHRPGQKYPVTVFQLVSNKLEIEIFRRLETQTSMQGVLLEMVRRGEI